MDKRLFHVYLAKECIPNNEAYAKLNLPASPWELWDALDKVRLNEGEQLYMPHLHPTACCIGRTISRCRHRCRSALKWTRSN